MDNKKPIASPTADLQRQQLLLRMEYEYEKEEFKRQTETMGIARKVKRGLSWYPVQIGRSYYNSLNQFVVEIIRTGDKDIEHAFEFGKPVCFFRQGYDDKISYMNFTATVSYADEERMVVALPVKVHCLRFNRKDKWGYSSILTKHPTAPCSMPLKTCCEPKETDWRNYVTH